VTGVSGPPPDELDLKIQTLVVKHQNMPSPL